MTNVCADSAISSGEPELAASSVRITLDAPGGAVAVSVPAEEPLDAFVDDLVAAVLPDAEAGGSWSLVARDGLKLDGRLSLRGLRVREDDVLMLHRLSTGEDACRDRCSLRVRTQLTLPARLPSSGRMQIALRTALSPSRTTRAHHGTADGGDPAALSLVARTPPWRRLRNAWTASDYEVRLDQRIESPRLTRCATIAVLSPKGGPGKTTVTALLGSLLAYLRSDRVVAVDANPDFGSLGRRLVPEHGVFIDDMLEGCLRGSELSATQFDGALGRGPDGLMVAPAPTDPDRASALDENAYRVLFEGLARFAGTLVLDCGTGLDAPPARAALSCADQIVLVTDGEPDTASLVWEAATWLGASSSPLLLVVNKHGAQSELDIEGFGRTVPFARGLVTISRDDDAATQLRSGRFSWSGAPPGWRVSLRELAVLLIAGWPGLALVDDPRM